MGGNWDQLGKVEQMKLGGSGASRADTPFMMSTLECRVYRGGYLLIKVAEICARNYMFTTHFLPGVLCLGDSRVF